MKTVQTFGRQFRLTAFLLAACSGGLTTAVVAQPSNFAWSPPSSYSGYQVIQLATTDFTTAGSGNYPTVSPTATRTSYAGLCALNLSNTVDYWIKLPATSAKGALEIVGGRNVVLIGGRIEMPFTNNAQSTTTPADSDRYKRAIYIKDGSSGTTVDGRVVHIEGVAINAELYSSDYQSYFDAIDTSCPKAIVQIVNCKAENVFGYYNLDATHKWAEVVSNGNPYPAVQRASGDPADWHGDVIQTFGGVKELRVDGLYCSSNYQGLFLKPDINTMERVALRHVSILNSEPLAVPSKNYHLNYMFWRSDSADNVIPPFSCNASNVNIQLRGHDDADGMLTHVNPDGDFGSGTDIGMYRGFQTASSPDTVSWAGVGSAVRTASSGALPTVNIGSPGTSYTTSSSTYSPNPVNTDLSPSPIITTNGTSQKIVCVYSHRDGAASSTNLQDVYLLVSSATNSTDPGVSTAAASSNALFIRYTRASNKIYLADNTGTFGTGYTVGSANTPSNTQGEVDVLDSTVVTNDKDLVLTLYVKPYSAFAGKRNLFQRAKSSTVDTGFELRGVWKIN